MLLRDRNGIILQHPLDKNSGGDSASRVGLMALFGSKLDQNCLLRFELGNKTGLLSRHPDFYNGDCYTRDQLLCFIAGLWKQTDPEALGLARRVFWSHAKRFFFCQNYRTQFTRVDKGFWGRDPLSISHIGHLILCARLTWLYPVLFFAYPWLIVEILWHCYITPRNEPNQLIAMLMTYDLVWLWVWLHPNWQWPIRDYWCGWRDQNEISDIIIEGIKQELVR